MTALRATRSDGRSRPRPLRRWLTGLAALWVVATFGGCAHYRLGPPELPFRTVAIGTIDDVTATPGFRPAFARALAAALSEGDTLIVVPDPAAAEAVVTFQLERVDRNPSVTRPDDTGRARQLDIGYYGRLTVADPRTGRKWIDAAPFGIIAPILPAEQTDAEVAALPLAARALAERAAALVRSTW